MKYRSEEEGHQLVKMYRASGLSQARFAEKARIGVAALRYWLRRVRELKRRNSKPVQFVELTPAHVETTTTGVCIETSSGVVIRFAHLPPIDYLTDIARDLSRR